MRWNKMEYIIAGGVLALLVVLYLWSYALNEKCEKPEGSEEQECQSCHARNCSARKNEIK
jgi:hypothetical protein